MQVPVVVIQTENGPLRINASDYVADMGPILAYDPPLTVPAPAAAVEPVPAPAAVSKQGKKWFVTDSKGNNIISDQYDAKGYTTESAAWDVILKGGQNA